jgi:hypothetical protein
VMVGGTVVASIGQAGMAKVKVLVILSARGVVGGPAYTAPAHTNEASTPNNAKLIFSSALRCLGSRVAFSR